MNGAESLLRTLVNGGVEVCFTNPGTSEMQFVAAVDRVEDMRCILGLFEGVVSGAADGYARMMNKPAATLLHLGPGLANALANLHNARKARVPLINIVGEHATYHRALDPPLASDIEAFAKPVSAWIKTVESASDIPNATHAAIQAAVQPPGQIATLVLPADCSWQESADPISDPVSTPEYPKPDDETIEQIARILSSGEPAALLMTGEVLHEPGLILAGKIAAKTGARLFCDTFVARHARGAGRTPVFSMPYFPEKAIETLTGLKHLVIVGTNPPVSFFAYPDMPNELTPEGVVTHRLTTPEQDGVYALGRLCDALNANNTQARQQELQLPALAQGELNPQGIAQSVAALLPEDSIIVDESISSGLSLHAMTANAHAHDLLGITGGSIGIGPPLATGAAVACPNRKVLCLQADGSAMYNLQALWTQAREGLNVTTVIYANRAYKILNFEYQRVGAGEPGPKAHSMMSLTEPVLDWKKLAEGMGVPAKSVTTADEFNRCLAAFLKEPGPNLIEAIF